MDANPSNIKNLLIENENLVDENKGLTKKIIISEQLLYMKKDKEKDYKEVIEKQDEMEL